MTIRLGTRRSALAMAQSQQVADRLAAVSGREVVLVPITSEGDVNRASLATLGGRGVFATRLREALLAGECDVLVHSLKDLPTAPAPGLVIAATPQRQDARDVVITRDGTPLAELHGSVGTGSPRRVAQVHEFNPRVRVADLRGNVDSRLGRVRDAELDAVILAAAGLNRLGDADPLGGLHVEPLGLAEWPTAPGQGSLAVEVREGSDLEGVVAALDDADTRTAVDAERAVLAALDGGCAAPVGVHASVTVPTTPPRAAGASRGASGRVGPNTLRIRAIVYSSDGRRRIGEDQTFSLPEAYAQDKGSGNGADAVVGANPISARKAGFDVARRLLDRGAADLVPRESTP
ncbi:porphobilinogen deaminase [Microbacterium mangrovi]|uniref:Hydroxymethylbilane synthase n=1 Tax=Microbacterium mangrovi TaxID=1348253 RepID=A0A0B2A8A5_9MICO|nr:hydroxymethylbilane synthase [Microbacterium mangrovi]KHK99803.1 porphobilinogen deaminase [Microbacterium mangrovi]